MRTLLSVALVVLVCALCIPVRGDAQWVKTAGPTGGRIIPMISSGDTLYVGTLGGIYRSTNTGESWSQIGFRGRTVRFLFHHGNELFASLDSTAFDPISGDTAVFTLYKTTDEGVTWIDASTGINLQTQGGSPQAMIYHGDSVLQLFTIGSTISTTSNFPKYRSTDRGLTWMPENGLRQDEEVRDVVTHGDACIAAGAGNIWRKSSPDATWRPVYSSGSPGDTWTLVQFGDVILTGGRPHTARSTDGGVTWHRLPDIGNSYSNMIVHRDTLLSIPSGYSTAILYSPDSGATWKPYHESSLGTSLMLSAGGELFLRTSYNIYRTLPGGSGERSMDSGLAASIVQQLTYADGVLYARADALYRSFDFGDTWELVGNGLPMEWGRFHSFAGLGRKLYATVRSGLYTSSDSGSTWRALLTDSGAFFEAGDIVGDEANVFVTTTYDGLWVSRDSGETWKPVPGLHKSVSSIHASGASIVAFASPVVYRSNDYGHSWDSLYTNLSGSVTSSDMVMLEGGVLLMAHLYKGLIRSTDSGRTWKELSPPIYAYTLAARGPKAIVGSPDGVYQSDRDGASWTLMNAGRDGSVYAVALAPDVAFAGTSGEGVWRHPINTSAVRTTWAFPESAGVRLLPNPAGNSAVAECSSTAAGYASIDIVNMLGEIVAGPFDEWREGGSWRIELNLAGIMPGSYHLRVRTADGIRTAPLMIVR